MVKREVVGAHYGLKDWLYQRVTALVMVAYTLVFFGVLLANPGMDFAAWRAVFANVPFKLLTFVFLLAVFLHAWVGVRDIFMDYLKPVSLRLSAEILAALALVFYTGWAIHILWGIK